MIYFGIAGVLICILLIYIKIADRYNIIDKPNERSSHSAITIRGGGIIFPFSLLVWYLFFGSEMPLLLIGVLIISVISFIDDVYTIKALPRFLVHLIAVILILTELGAASWPWYLWILTIVLVIGWLNAFNFMDGINGITVFYGLAVVLPIAWLNRVNLALPESLLTTTMMGLLIFAFFNARKKAKVFAGDVGSISLGLILSFFLMRVMFAEQSWYYIFFVAIYGVDAVITILQRLIKRENIFQAHRTHLYQYLANERKIPHVWVSTWYALLQFILSFGLILISPGYQLLYVSVVFALLCITYFPLKSWAKGGAA